MIPIIEIKGVSKVFKLQDQTINALADANLTIRKGEFICLIGASGCGKSHSAAHHGRASSSRRGARR